MIDRYSREEMKKIWDLNSKFNYYLKVEKDNSYQYDHLKV